MRFKTLQVIKCSRSASNDVKNILLLDSEQNLLRTRFLGSRLSSGRYSPDFQEDIVDRFLIFTDEKADQVISR